MPWGRVRCSFCGKDKESVAKLVAGRHGYICDVCVGAVSRIIDASNAAPPRNASPGSPTLLWRLRAVLGRLFESARRTVPASAGGTA